MLGRHHWLRNQSPWTFYPALWTFEMGPLLGKRLKIGEVQVCPHTPEELPEMVVEQVCLEVVAHVEVVRPNTDLPRFSQFLVSGQRTMVQKLHQSSVLYIDMDHTHHRHPAPKEQASFPAAGVERLLVSLQIAESVVGVAMGGEEVHLWERQLGEVAEELTMEKLLVT